MVKEAMLIEVDEDLNEFEKDIRQLKIEFEQYFGGGRPRPPNDTLWRTDNLVKKLTENPGMNSSQRFRFNNLAQTYAKYQELWRKRLREREEGYVPRHFGAAARAIVEERNRRRGEVTGNIRISCSDPEHEPEKVRQLYRALVTARERAGIDTAPPHFEQFSEYICRKAGEVKPPDGSVEFEVKVQRNKVRLTVRVKR